MSGFLASKTCAKRKPGAIYITNWAHVHIHAPTALFSICTGVSENAKSVLEIQ